jgi:hypothetical protein
MAPQGNASRSITARLDNGADIVQDEAAAGLNLKLLRKPYKQADLARAMREVLEA